MVEITERVLLSYKDAKEVAIPRNLLHVADGGERYLKIQGSHMAVCKLAAGGHFDTSNARTQAYLLLPTMAY